MSAVQVAGVGIGERLVHVDCEHGVAGLPLGEFLLHVGGAFHDGGHVDAGLRAFLLHEHG